MKWVIATLVLLTVFTLIAAMLYQYSLAGFTAELSLWMILLLVVVPSLWVMWVKSIIVPLRSRAALVLYEDHLVIACEAGVLEIPKTAITDIPKLDTIPRQQLYVYPRVSVAVLPEYQIDRWYGRKGNPSFPAYLVKGHTQYEILSDLSHWLAE
jgi:hypothetical protein